MEHLDEKNQKDWKGERTELRAESTGRSANTDEGRGMVEDGRRRSEAAGAREGKTRAINPADVVKR